MESGKLCHLHGTVVPTWWHSCAMRVAQLCHNNGITLAQCVSNHTGKEKLLYECIDIFLSIFVAKGEKRMNQRYPSTLLENAVNELSSLPGIGRKTALRLALYMLRRDESYTESFAEALTALRKEVKYCRVCHNICDHERCLICANPQREHSLVCVVESIKEVMAIENTGQFNGVYHVLGGRISPIEGVGPGDLEINSLIERVKEGEVKEVILALSTTMDGDMTNFFINRKLSGLDVRISVIARGVSIGDELEYADEVTLGRSILNRTLFSDSLKQ